MVATKQKLRARDELVGYAIEILHDLVPRAVITHVDGAVQIDLRKAHQSDEHERVEVQRELMERLRSKMQGKLNVTQYEYTESHIGTRRSKSKLKIGLEGESSKIFAFELTWLEPTHSGIAINDEGVKLSGEENEANLANIITAHTVTSVLFKDKHGHKLLVDNVAKVKHVGGENNLTDVELITEDGEIIKLSVKKQLFREVRSAASLLTDKAEYLDFIGLALDELVGSKQVDIKLKRDRNGDEYYGFDNDKHHEVAIEIDTDDQQAMYFKDGNEHVDAVIVQSFTPANFKVKDEILEVACALVLLPGDEIPAFMTPFLRARVDNISKGVKRMIVLDGKKVSLKLEVVPRSQLGRYKRHHIETKQELPERTHIAKL